MVFNSNASVEDQKRGWTEESGSGCRALVCVRCGQRFEDGRVYAFSESSGNTLYTAEGAVRRHVLDAHGGALMSLLETGRERAVLSEAQAIVLNGLAAGDDDAKIAASLGNRAASTVRNHRRNLRLRAAEARTFVAIMELIEDGLDVSRRQVDFGPDMPANDDRVDVSEGEAAAIEAKYFAADGSIPRIPTKEKHKLILLRRIVERFDRGRDYSDAEVRSALGAVNEDHALLRRYLIDYGFMSRDDEGRVYRRL